MWGGWRFQGPILGSGSAKANLDHRRATSAHTHTPQDKYHTVHRYMDIVTWQEGQRGCTKERPGQESHGYVVVVVGGGMRI